MINPLVEALISPADATSLYPKGPKGKKIHISRIYRDMNRGCRGIVLESIRTPRLATTREAVARFFHRLSNAHQQGCQVNRIDVVGERANREVERELDQLGI